DSPIRIPADEVVGDTREGDEPAVRRDGRARGDGVALGVVRGDTHPLRRARQAVVDVDIEGPIRIPADEVGGVTLEGDEPAVGRDGRPEGVGVALAAVRGDTYLLRHARQAVVDVDIRGPSRIDEVGA